MAAETLSPLLIQTYDRKLHGVPQRPSVLKDTVRMETGIVGMNHHFPAIGKAIARTRAALQPVQASPTVKARPKADFELKEHFEFLADHEAAQTNVSAAAKYGMNSNDAVERACDQWIIDAMETVSTSAIGPTPIPDQAVSFAADAGANEMAKVLMQLLDRGVSTGDMLTIAYDELMFQSIAKIEQLISRDYSERGFVSSAKIPRLWGMQWRGVEHREEGGISPDTRMYVYARESTGLALGTIVRQRRIGWREDLLAYQIGARILGGATRIDNNMILRVTATKTA